MDWFEERLSRLDLTEDHHEDEQPILKPSQMQMRKQITHQLLK